MIFLISTVVDCGNLTAPANGQVDLTSRTTFGQTATYSCNTGYNLVGDSTRTCEATGNWSGSAPFCQSMLLQGVSFLSYVHIQYETQQYVFWILKRHESIVKGITMQAGPRVGFQPERTVE